MTLKILPKKVCSMENITIWVLGFLRKGMQYFIL
jgi:hypothetical protein